MEYDKGSKRVGNLSTSRTSRSALKLTFSLVCVKEGVQTLQKSKFGFLHVIDNLFTFVYNEDTRMCQSANQSSASAYKQKLFLEN